MTANQLAQLIINGINNGLLPATLNLTPRTLKAGWNVTQATAQEAAWILRDNFKLTGTR